MTRDEIIANELREALRQTDVGEMRAWIESALAILTPPAPRSLIPADSEGWDRSMSGDWWRDAVAHDAIETAKRATRPLIEAVCDCGHRGPVNDPAFHAHMDAHSSATLRHGGPPFYFHHEHDGVDLDALSGAERKRRASSPPTT